MLVLSRKIGQEIVIGDAIRITVHRIAGSRVILGICAPNSVRVVRGELNESKNPVPQPSPSPVPSDVVPL